MTAAQQKIKPKQLDFLVGESHWSAGGLILAPGTSQTVTTFFTGLTAGGSDTSVGVLTTSPVNKVFLREAATGHMIKDTVDGVSVFARLTTASGAWTLNYYVLVNGTEVPFDFTGHPLVGAAINFRWCEVVQASNYKPTCIVNAGEGIDEYSASSAASHLHIAESLTVTSTGQVTFTLTQTPKFPTAVTLTVNSGRYYAPSSFTVTGNSLTWTATAANSGFDFETTDNVIAEYEYAG